jgi:uncharacterized membrane protein YkvA (DUF1232 family)
LTSLLVGFFGALAFTWVVFLVVLWAFKPPDQSVADLVRVFPDCLRLAVALYRDESLPRSARWKLRIAVIYNVQPFNLIPDFVPVIGFADNAVVLIWALRAAMRSVDALTVRRSWSGSVEGLTVVLRVLRIPPPGGTADL